MRRKNKKAIIKILEAFIALLIIMTVLLVVVARQEIREDRNQEIIKMQRFMLNEILKNNEFRNQILNNNTLEVETFVNQTRPSWMDSHIKICNYKEICSLGFIVEKNVYADEIFITTNITDYRPEALKLKLFLWEK